MEFVQPILVLDIDGVLVNGDAPHKAAVYALCAGYGCPISDTEYEPTLFLSMEKQWAKLPARVKEKISLKTYLSEVPFRTKEIIDTKGIEVLPGAAELIRDAYLNDVLIVCCTSGQGRLPHKKLRAVLDAVTKLPGGCRIQENKIPIVQHESLQIFGEEKPNAGVYRAAARVAARKHSGFQRHKYRPDTYMNHAVVIEDADKTIPGAVASGASVIQVRFMNNSPQPGALFVETLADPRVMEKIMSKRTLRKAPIYSASRRPGDIITP